MVLLMPTKPLDYLVKEVKIKLPQTNPKKEKENKKRKSMTRNASESINLSNLIK
jgi:hypothetical protein